MVRQKLINEDKKLGENKKCMVWNTKKRTEDKGNAVIFREYVNVNIEGDVCSVCIYKNTIGKNISYKHFLIVIVILATYSVWGFILLIDQYSL